MFPVVSRGRPPQQTAETGHGGRDTRQPAVVSLELKATRVTGGHAEAVDVQFFRHRNRKPRNRSFSPLRHDTPCARTDVGSSSNLSESKTTSCKSALTDDVVSPMTAASRDGLSSDNVRQSHRFHPVADSAAAQATTTSKQIAVARLPPLLNVDSECRVSQANEATQPRKSEGTARPFEVCALRLNPDIKSLTTRARCHRQQTAAGVANGNKNTAKNMPATSSSLPQEIDGAGEAVKFDLRLPLSDNDNDDEEKDDEDDDDNQETAECCPRVSGDKMSMDGSVSCDRPGITVASCPILSVRIEFCKSQRKPIDSENTTPSTTTQSDSGCSSSGDAGGRRRLAGRTPHKTKNAKAVSKPTSTSKAISVAGRGKVVVIDDAVYDQFARRQPPKYLSNRMLYFDAVLNKRAFSK